MQFHFHANHFMARTPGGTPREMWWGGGGGMWACSQTPFPVYDQSLLFTLTIYLRPDQKPLTLFDSWG